MDQNDDKTFVIEHHEEGGSRVVVSFEHGADRATLVYEERTRNGAWRGREGIEVTQSALEAALRHMRGQKLIRARGKLEAAQGKGTASERIRNAIMRRVVTAIAASIDGIDRELPACLLAGELAKLGDLGVMLDPVPAQQLLEFRANVRARRIAGLCEHDGCENSSQVDSVLCEQHELQADATLADEIDKYREEGGFS